MRTLRRSLELLGIALAALGAASTSAGAAVDLGLTKERTGGAGPVAVGEEATFRLTVSNAGTTDATGVTVVDTLPAGLTPVGASSGCTTAGQVVTCALTLRLGQFDHPFFDVRARAEPVAAASVVSNEAVATANEPDANPSDNHASLGVTVGPYSALAVAASASPASVLAGAAVRLTAIVRNQGPSPAMGVRALVRLPPGLLFNTATPSQGVCAGPACDLGGLPAGGQATIEIVAGAHVFAVGRHVATVEATATGPSASGAADVAVDVTPVAAPAVPAALPPDLAVAVRPPRAVREGLAGTWRLEVVNRGPGPAAAVLLRGAASPSAELVGVRGGGARCGPVLPVTCSLGALAPGERRTVALGLRPRQPGRLIVTGSVAGAEAETTDANNLAGARRRAAAGRARLTLRVRPAAAPVGHGERVTFLVTVGNRSHVTARRLRVCGRPPGAPRICWALARLRPGGSRTYPVTATAPGSGRAAATATARAANSAPAAARAAVRVLSP
jgi:large repetitive protein